MLSVFKKNNILIRTRDNNDRHLNLELIQDNNSHIKPIVIDGIRECYFTITIDNYKI